METHQRIKQCFVAGFFNIPRKLLSMILLLITLSFGQMSAETNVSLKLPFKGEGVNSKEIVSRQQQEQTVTGKVADAYGDFLPGVTVLIKGTSSGTVTDVNGNFTLNNVPRNSILVDRKSVV